MALADQKAGVAPRLRQPVPVLAGRSAAFRDIKPGSEVRRRPPELQQLVDASAGFANPTVRTIDADLQSLRTLNGYDTLTGLGAPNGASFVGAG